MTTGIRRPTARAQMLALLLAAGTDSALAQEQEPQPDELDALQVTAGIQQWRIPRSTAGQRHNQLPGRQQFF